jgi:RHS repeat-associated protein
MRIIKSSVLYSMTYFSMVFMACGFFVLPSVSFAEDSKPSEKVNMGGGSGNSSGAGTVTPDLFTGTMSYSIPIEVPEGRHGMSPGLSLDYRSNNGNGWVGVGWELEVGAIERSLKSGVSYTGDNYILRIAGGTMDLVNIGDNEYRAKIEGAFYRIVKTPNTDGSPIYWTVYDKSGMKYTFGQTAYSGGAVPKQDDPNDATKVFKWCLDSVTDTNHNFMTFSYTKDQGQIYLDRIDYSGNGSTNPTNYVKFYLESRTDAPNMYTTNFSVKTGKRLKTIEVKANGQYPAGNQVRAYKLEYDADSNTHYSAITGRSLLGSVQQFGKDYTTSLPAVLAGWQGSISSSGTYNKVVTPVVTSDWDTSKMITGDYNGDGKMDFLSYFNNQLITFLSNGDGTYNKVPMPVDVSDWSASIMIPGDYDGDGKTDFLSYYNSNLITFLSNGAGTYTKKVVPVVASDWSASIMIPGDYNGDGKTDFLSYYNNNLITFFSNGTGTYNKVVVPVVASDWSSSKMIPGDYNGDGKTDFLSYYNNTLVTFFSNGTGTYNKVVVPVVTSDWDTSRMIPGDYNGDGKTDFLSYYNNTLITFFSNGTGTYTKVVTPVDVSDWSTSIMIPGDYNGDGKTDFLSYYNNTLITFYSNGDGTYTKVVKPVDAYDWSASIMIPGDYNGYGRTGFLSYYNQKIITFTPDGLFPDSLNSIQNGLGGTTTITYKPSTQYSNTLLPFPVQTVSSVTTNDGRGVVSTVAYSYSGGYYHIGDHDFRGFNHVTISGPIGPNTEQTITETWFHQGNSTAVDPANPEATVDDPANSVGFMKGKPYYTKVTDGSHNIYSASTTSYALVSTGSTSVYFYPAYEVNSYIYGSNPVVRTRTVLTYDGYGNVTKEEQYGDVSVPTDDRTVERIFAHNDIAWIVGMPTRELIYSGISASLVSQTDYYYDYASDCNTASANQVPTIGNVTRIVRMLSGGTSPETRMAYDSYGNLICTRDPMGNTSTVSYDSTSIFPLESRNALDQVTTTTYYAGDLADKGLYGQVKSVTALHLSSDTAPPATTMEYDALGRKTKVIAPDGTWASWSYPAVNSATGNTFGVIGSQHIMTDNSAGLTARAYFDGLGRTYLQKQDGPDGKTIVSRSEYNATGTVKQASMPYFDGTEAARYTTYTYDAFGRTTQIKNYPDEATVLGCYNGVVTVGIDADGHRKRETRDALGRLVKVEEYMGTIYTSCTTDALVPYATTYYDYDILGHIVKVTDAASNITVMSYDSLGRKIYMKDPDMGEWSYEYYANGNLWKQTDANLQTITFEYDALNRVTTKNYPTGTGVGYIYDEPTSTYPVGRLTEMADASGTTTYHYDIMGRSSLVIKNIGGSDYSISTIYDNGRPSNITYPDGETISYSYGTGNALTSVRSESANYIYAYYQNYNALGQPGSITYGNGVITTYQYDPKNNRLLNISTAGPAQQLLDLSYEYSKGGNVKSITDNLSPNISSMAVSGQTISYYYQGSRPHAVTSTNDGITYEYDKNTNGNGNMTFDGARRIDYDYNNMPKSILSSLGTTTLVYDGAGARVKKAGPFGETVYIGKLYECMAGNCLKYIYGGAARIAVKSDVAMFYYHQDHLGSSRVITSETGENLDQVYYDPFGATSADVGGMSVSHKYTSQEFDAETGLYYYNARYYNPALGRFISADTIVPSPSNPQALNRYSYVLNNPMIYADPTGHRSWRKTLKYVSFQVGVTQYNDRLLMKYPAARAIEGSIAGAYGGPLGAAAFSGYMTYLGGGSTRDIVMSAGISGASSAIFQSLGEWKPSEFGESVGKLAFVGTTGGAFSVVQGGTFWRGFALSAGSEAARMTYTASLNTEAANCNTCKDGEALWDTGGDAGVKGDGVAVSNRFNNNVGLKVLPGENIGFWSEGGEVSNFANGIPGINSTAVLHDIWNPAGATGWNTVQSVATMIPAAAVTYGGLLNGNPMVQLSVDISKK